MLNLTRLGVRPHPYSPLQSYSLTTLTYTFPLLTKLAALLLYKYLQQFESVTHASVLFNPIILFPSRQSNRLVVNIKINVTVSKISKTKNDEIYVIKVFFA